MFDEVNEIDQSNLTMRDMLVVSSETENALIPATAVNTDDNNTTHVGMLRFGDCDISVDNAKISAPHETANLTFKTPNLTLVYRTCALWRYLVYAYGVIIFVRFLQPLAPLCGSFLPVLNPVVIPGFRAGTCCAVLRGSLLIVCKQVRLSFV